MKEERILISTDGPDRNVLKLKPPMVFTVANADLLVTTLDQVLTEIKEGADLIGKKATDIITADLQVETKKMKIVPDEKKVSIDYKVLVKHLNLI